MEIYKQIITNSKQYTKNLVVIAIVLMIASIIINALKGRKKKNKFVKTTLPFIHPPIGTIIFGKASFHRLVYCSSHEGHINIVGSSGSGKTQAVILPALNNNLGSGSKQTNVFCIDISGDIEKGTNMSKKLVYEPDGKASNPYNVFWEIDQLFASGKVNEVQEALEKLGYILVPPVNGDSSSVYFSSGARSILIGALVALYSPEMDFVDIVDIIVTNGYEKLFKRISESQKGKAWVSQFEKNNPANIAGCYQNLVEKLLLFRSPIIRKNLRRPLKGEIDVYPERLEEYSVFLNVPDNKLDIYQPLVNLVCSQVMAYCSNRDLRLAREKELWIVLDEFSSLGRLMDIQDSARKYRKRGVRLIIAYQSYSDIQELYGVTGSRSLLNNFRYTLILNAIDTETSRILADLIGHDPDQKKKANAEWLIAPEDLSTLDLTDELVLISPSGYKILRKNFWYQKWNRIYI
jgi:type IV secretory pathway TraG/TraD family ATPase VirD4